MEKSRTSAAWKEAPVKNMKNKLQKAVSNNNGLYEAVFGCLDIRSRKTAKVWYTLKKTPPLYSNLVTLSEDWRPDEIFKAIDLICKKENWKEWSIKDSFHVLNLSRYGFEKLFDARWIHLKSTAFTPLTNSSGLRYKVLKTEKALSEWRVVWDPDRESGEKIFNSGLLDNPEVSFIAGYDGERIVSGCFLNKTGDVLGISNFFAPSHDIRYWSDTVGFIFDAIARLDVVGYERNELAAGLQKLGFEQIGELAVWLKKRA